MSTRLPGAKYKSVFDSGRVVRGRLMSAWVVRHPDAGRKAGVIVSKKSFHDAVDRNRAKRIMREAFRLSVSFVPEDSDWILVGRSSLKGRKTADVASELRWMCGRL